MENNNYKPVQLPINSFKLLKEYCDKNGFKMGKFLEKIIEKNCIIPKENRILYVKNDN